MSNRKISIAFIIVAIPLICAFVANTFYYHISPTSIFGDSSTYWDLAKKINNKGLYAESWPKEEPFRAWRPPAYAFFLSFIIKLPKPDLFVQVIQALMMLSSSILIGLIVHSITKGHFSFFTSIVLFAYFEPLIKMIFVSMSEILFVFSITSFLFSYCNIGRSNYKNLMATLSGFFLGVSVLTRNVSVPIIVVILFHYTYVKFCTKKDAPIQYVYVLVISIALTLSWTLRNYIVLGQVVPISTNNYFNLYMGSLENALSNWDRIHENVVNPLRQKLGEVGSSKELRSMFFDRIFSSPIDYVLLKVEHFLKVAFLYPSKSILGVVSAMWVPISLMSAYKFRKSHLFLFIIMSLLSMWLVSSLPMYKSRWVLSLYPLIVISLAPYLGLVLRTLFQNIEFVYSFKEEE